VSVLEINLVVGVVAFLLLAYMRWRSQRKLYFKYYGGTCHHTSIACAGGGRELTLSLLMYVEPLAY
jgi:hypothetical protein